MTRPWTDLEGVSLAGRYWLKQRLTENENDAWFLSRHDAACDVAVRVLRADTAAADQLELWRAAIAIDHPHIVRMLDAGRADAEGIDVLYAVCEYPDDFLASVLAERPLSKAEAREVLDACLSALGFLHERGLVHGAVAAEHIMAFGSRIKLPSDRIRRAENPAEDLWDLGATLAEVLTRERPQPGADIPWVPEPFGTIVQRTMGAAPAERWSVEDIQRFLNPPATVAVPAAVAVTPVESPAETVVQSPEPEPQAVATPEAVREPERRREYAPEGAARHGYGLKWVPIAGLVAAAGLGAFFLPHSKEPQPVATPAVQRAPAPVPAQRHTEAAPPVENAAARRRNPAAIWRVVVYEYSQRMQAEHRAKSLNEKRPELHAEVFSPKGNHAPYLVALGGFMTYDEAERMRKQARAEGMPRDTFVRNYRQ